MAEIIPAIIATTLEEVEEKIRLVEGAAGWVHIDIVDGQFAAPETWPYNTIEGVINAPKLKEIKTDLNIELHLMIENPDNDLDEWLDTQAKRILIHQEASADPHQALTLLYMSKIEEGLVLNLDTPVAQLADYHDMIEVVQLMSIPHLGSYGAKFSETVLKKIREVKSDYPELKLQIDGGMNEETIKKVIDAGADRIVVGSAIFGANDPAQALRKIISLAK